MAEAPLFLAAEFERRVTRLQEGMAAQDISALLLTSAADIFYVTGFLTRFWESPARPWFVIVPASGAPTAVIPAIGAPLMARSWIDDIRTWDAPMPGDDGVSLLVEALCEMPRSARIGVPKGLETHLRMPLADFERVAAALAPREFDDATAIVQRVREVKSEAEIARIRATCALAARAFARVPEIARGGVPLCDVFRRFQMLLLEEGADWVSYLAGAAGPGGYGDVISPATDAPLRAGDILMLDTGAVRDGYFCDFDRNFCVGPAGAEVTAVHHALWDVTSEALELLRPGMRARDAHGLLWNGLRARGATPCAGRLGHGLGVTLTEWPSFTAHDTTVLREGMVLTLEPSAEVAPGRALVHEENIVLRAHGAELLSPRAPRDMVEIVP